MTELLNNNNGPGHYSIKEAVHKLLAWGWGRGWGWRYDASVQNCEFLSRSGEACKSRGGVFSEFPLGSLPASCFLTLEGLPAARHGDPVPPPPGHRVPSPPLLPTSLPSRAPPSQGAEGNRPALGGSTLVSKRRGSGGCHDCPVSRPRESSPEEQARAEVRFLQRVGLQVQRRHCAGWGRRGAALRCSGCGEAPAAPGGDCGNVGDQSAFAVCGAGPETHRLLGVEHPQPPKSPPPRNAQPPGSPPGHQLGAAVRALGEVGPCVGLQDEEAVRPKLLEAACKLGGKATGSLMEDGRQTGQHSTNQPAPRIPPGCKLY